MYRIVISKTFLDITTAFKILFITSEYFYSSTFVYDVDHLSYSRFIYDVDHPCDSRFLYDVDHLYDIRFVYDAYVIIYLSTK